MNGSVRGLRSCFFTGSGIGGKLGPQFWAESHNIEM